MHESRQSGSYWDEKMAKSFGGDMLETKVLFQKEEGAALLSRCFLFGVRQTAEGSTLSHDGYWILPCEASFEYSTTLLFLFTWPGKTVIEKKKYR